LVCFFIKKIWQPWHQQIRTLDTLRRGANLTKTGREWGQCYNGRKKLAKTLTVSVLTKQNNAYILKNSTFCHLEKLLTVAFVMGYILPVAYAQAKKCKLVN
jgi:hypothetical protein